MRRQEEGPFRLKGLGGVCCCAASYWRCWSRVRAGTCRSRQGSIPLVTLDCLISYFDHTFGSWALFLVLGRPLPAATRVFPHSKPSRSVLPRRCSLPAAHVTILAPPFTARIIPAKLRPFLFFHFYSLSVVGAKSLKWLLAARPVETKLPLYSWVVPAACCCSITAHVRPQCTK